VSKGIDETAKRNEKLQAEMSNRRRKMSLDFKPFMKQKQQEQADKMNIDRLND
jgi:hypothetical protein